MANELNDLSYNNTPITFTGKTDNTKTSDETSASLLYQDKMGTVYSKSKGIAHAFNFAGISLILTAAAIKTGSLISNVFILNPPSVSDPVYGVSNNTFTASFTISNPGKYKVYYFLSVNENINAVLTDDCSEEQEYLVSYDGLSNGNKYHFYITFTNKVDYTQKIESYTLTLEE